nr:PD-(D/E)XK nuclease family protein [Lachnospiraceae bacterium]
AEDMQKKEREFSPTVPAFMTEDIEKGVNEGALRGTAMHRYMECFDFHRDDYKDAYEAELNRMYDEGKLEEKQKALLSREKIETFLKSDLARRMHDAAVRDELYEERAFVFGDTAESLFSGIDEAAGGENKDLIMVQGIIDAFFIEDGEIVVLDYKTDRVKNADELKALYNKQLEIYGNAISKAFDMPVKEEYLYSFSLNETILLWHDL